MSLYIYNIKMYMGDRINMFWTLGFPIILATLFTFTFGNTIKESSSIQPINVAVVQKSENSYFNNFLAETTNILSPVYKNEEDAKKLLESDEVLGIITVGEEISLSFKENGARQSIVKGMVDRFLQVSQTVAEIAHKNPEKLQDTIKSLNNFEAASKEISLSGGSLAPQRQYFYALIAMTCLYSGFLGLKASTAIQANMSALGLRQAVGAKKKAHLFLASLAACQSLAFLTVAITLVYINFVLGIKLSGGIFPLAMLCFAGTLCGVLLGMLLGIGLKAREGAKIGILISVCMVFSFLGGLMFAEMWNIVQKTAPILNRLNPAALIVDALYALDSYGAGTRFYSNISNLLLIAAVTSVFCIAFSRRKQHASV